MNAVQMQIVVVTRLLEILQQHSSSEISSCQISHIKFSAIPFGQIFG